MKKILSVVVLLLFAGFSTSSYGLFGENFCGNPGVYCYKVRGGDSWDSLFPNQVQRDVAMRLNRMNIALRPGFVIAIPRNPNTTIIDIAPFATKIHGTGQKQIVIDLGKLAWGAYDESGYLVHWGPASGGKGFCPDENQVCRTMTGNFKIIRKQPAGCVSSVYPMEWDGGAPMPYCMHFFEGYALHGSYDVPGFNASHGCVRMFINDARWLNERFASIGTRVKISD